jgi:predicted PurR-regulated permease PerM
LAGIPGAGLLAFAVMILAIVQIGAAIVLVPVIIWIWIDKDFTTAVLMTVFLCIVGILDNVLKPLVMGRGLTTPTLVIFVGVIGGTLAHGIVGLFIGTDHPLRGLGIDGRLDTHRSYRRGIAEPTFER